MAANQSSFPHQDCCNDGESLRCDECHALVDDDGGCHCEDPDYLDDNLVNIEMGRRVKDEFGLSSSSNVVDTSQPIQ